MGVNITSEATTGFVRLLIDSNTVVSTYVNQSPGYIPLSIKGNRNSTLKLTSNLGADKNYFILINYREE